MIDTVQPRRISAVLLALSLWFAGGCSAYDARYTYLPRPSETVVYLEDSPNAAPIRMLSSMIGVRRQTKEPGSRPIVETAILFDNTSPLTIAFKPDTAALFTGNAQRFPNPDLIDQQNLLIGPGQTVRTTLLFPVPEDGQLDLNGLNLRWAIEHEGQLYYQSSTFERKPPQTYRHDAYYYGYPSPYDHYFYHRHFRH